MVMRLFLQVLALVVYGKSIMFYADNAFQQATFWAVLGVWASIMAEIEGR